MYDLPDQIHSTVAGLAKQAQQQGEQDRPRATFASKEEAYHCMGVGRDMEALAAMPGWQAFSFMLAGFAWAMAWGVKNCKVEDAPHYIEARTQIVELLRSLQTVIDRGQDAAAWLERATEEQQETH